MVPVKHLYLIGLGIALVIGASIMGAAYIYVTKGVAAHDQLKQDTKERVEETKKSDRTAENGLRETKRHIAQISARVETPKDVIVSLPLIHSPFAQYVQEVKGPLPDSPSQLVITSPEGFFHEAGACEGVRAELETCTTKLTNANERAGLQEKRAVDAEKVMKGGGFFSRLKSNAKWLIIGAGTGAAIGYAAHR